MIKIPKFIFIIIAIIICFTPNILFAKDSSTQANINTTWTILAACLVFLMQAGFAAVEIGLTRAKNALNIIMKNLMDFSVGSLTFYFTTFIC